jgi:hypothetical protein
VFDQRFDTRGQAPARTSVAPFVSVGLGSALDIASGFHTGIDLAAETHFMRTQASAQQEPELQVSFGLRASLLVGKRF